MPGYALIGHTFFKGAQFGGNTPPLNTVGANLIVLNTSPNDVGGPTTPTDNQGNTYNLIISENELQAYSQLWFCVNPITSPLHIFSSASATPNFMGISVAAFSGSRSNPFNQACGNDNRPPSVSNPYAGSMPADRLGIGLLPGENNCLIVVGMSGDQVSVDVPGGFAIDSGFVFTDTYFQEPFTCLSGGLAYLIQSTAALVDPVVTAQGWTGFGSMALTMATFFSNIIPPPPASTRRRAYFVLP